MGNRLEAVKGTSEQMPQVVTTYQYDEANRLEVVDGAVYEWDANGNLLSDGENRYTYDAGNHLIGVENAAGTAQYVYNGLGDRVSQTVNGITTNFVLDLNSGLTQVLQESAPQGYGAYTYLYGTDRIAQYGAVSTEYFLGDALGSVRQMVDASGAVILAKSYDPYGNVKASTGTGASRYGYTGEQSDSYIKLIYLRSRYYSPPPAGSKPGIPGKGIITRLCRTMLGYTGTRIQLTEQIRRGVVQITTWMVNVTVKQNIET